MAFIEGQSDHMVGKALSKTYLYSLHHYMSILSGQGVCGVAR